jgi:hypothetical protein
VGAKLEELAAGLHGNVTRADAKGLAKLHGHRWFDLRHAMLKIGPLAFKEYASDPGPSLSGIDRSTSEPIARSIIDSPGPGIRAVVAEGIAKGWFNGS